MTVRIPLAFLAAGLAASRAHAIADDTAVQQASSIPGPSTMTPTSVVSLAATCTPWSVRGRKPG